MLALLQQPQLLFLSLQLLRLARHLCEGRDLGSHDLRHDRLEEIIHAADAVTPLDVGLGLA
jgi:hypothetical protein